MFMGIFLNRIIVNGILQPIYTEPALGLWVILVPFYLSRSWFMRIFSMAANKLQKFFAPISYIGKNSYEIYLIHVALYDIVFRRLTNYTNCIEKNTSTFIVLSFILSITLGILYKKLFTYIMAKFSQFTHG